VAKTGTALRIVESHPTVDAVAAELAKREGRIERALRGFVEIGEELSEIHDRNLYVEAYSNFTNYLRRRWNLQPARAYRIMKAANVARLVSPMGSTSLITERVARELVPLADEPDLLKSTWEELCARHPRPTARLAQELVQSARPMGPEARSVRNRAIGITPGAADQRDIVTRVLEAIVLLADFEPTNEFVADVPAGVRQKLSRVEAAFKHLMRIKTLRDQERLLDSLAAG
jgi:hypothetical protein